MFRDEPEAEEEMSFWKFSECSVCTNRQKPLTCRICGAGEEFQEEDEPGLDELFRS